MGYNLLPTLHNLVLKLSQICLVGVPSRWHLCPFGTFPSFFEHFLAFWHHKVFQAHLVLSLPQFWNQTFLQGALGPKVENVFRSQDLGARCTCCYWGAGAPRPSLWLGLGDICVFICVYMLYQYIMCLYPSICLSIHPSIHPSISLT